jgi:hypothetical protein
VGVTSPEIQVVGEISGAGLLAELEKDDARITDIMRSTCASTYEADVSDDEGEKAAGCRRLERGLGWARRVFDELILPVTTVSPLDLGA